VQREFCFYYTVCDPILIMSRKGYATLDYEEAGWRESKLVKLQLLVNKQPVDAICRVVHSSQVDRIGRHWASKFKEHVERQMFGECANLVLLPPRVLYLQGLQR
jgi:translation elongation factor EF-4